MVNTALTLSRDYIAENVEVDLGTAGNSVVRAPVLGATAAQLTESTNDLRRRVAVLSIEIDETHQRAYDAEWKQLTQERGAQSPVDLLNALGDLGFAWRDIARMVGVTVPAVQKWRRGERITGSNRLKVAQLLAACDFLAAHFYVEDVASWFEMPLTDGAPVTPIDLWAAGETRMFFDYGTRCSTADSVLMQLDPDWRDRYQSDYETFRDADGSIGIRMQDR